MRDNVTMAAALNLNNRPLPQQVGGRRSNTVYAQPQNADIGLQWHHRVEIPAWKAADTESNRNFDREESYGKESEADKLLESFGHRGR